MKKVENLNKKKKIGIPKEAFDAANFPFAQLKDFSLKGWYYGKIVEELRPLTSQEELAFYFQNEALIQKNSYPGNFHFFSLQMNGDNEKIVTILESDEHCCHKLHYLVYDGNGRLMSDNIVAETGGDVEWSYERYGRFTNDSTYLTIHVELTELLSDNHTKETRIDSVITDFRFYKDRSFQKLNEHKFINGKPQYNP